jgi:hypothetical protein
MSHGKYPKPRKHVILGEIEEINIPYVKRYYRANKTKKEKDKMYKVL